MEAHGLPIVIMFTEDLSIVQTAYCGTQEMFSPASIPDFVKTVSIGKDINVSLSRADFNNFLNFVKEHCTSLVRQY